MKKNIDIIVRVIDNYWDIGFACELIIWLRSLYPEYHYRVWTDDVDRVQFFFEKNQCLLPEYSISCLDMLPSLRGAEVLLCLFQADIPSREVLARWSLVLRIDYLSLDPEWIKYHGSEHPFSTEEYPIYQIIPAIGMDGWWVIQHDPRTYPSREILAHEYHLDLRKRWVSFFLYRDTYARIDLSDVPWDVELLVFWWWETLSKESSIHIFPFVPLDVLYACIFHSEWSIIRGEVSFITAFTLEKKFYWDMYKQIWWYPDGQSWDFLSLVGNDVYSDLHLRINGQKSWPIHFTELDAFSLDHASFFPESVFRTKNLITEIKKYIDSHKFSI